MTGVTVHDRKLRAARDGGIDALTPASMYAPVAEDDKDDLPGGICSAWWWVPRRARQTWSSRTHRVNDLGSGSRVLATNAKRRGNEAQARTPAPLTGLMRCTRCGAAMTPTHTRRRGRLYRYYFCLGAIRRGHDTRPVRSIAASEAEGLVLGQVRRLLASPEMVARTITAVRRENGAAEETELEEGDVIEALAALEPMWDELYPAEQARILRL